MGGVRGPRERGRPGLGLGTKLQLVLTLVAASVVLVAVLGDLRLAHFEGRMVDLYEHRVVPLRELKAVSDRYAIHVVDTVHKVCALRIPASLGQTLISAALDETDAAWRRFTATRTTPADLALIAETTPLLENARAAAVLARELMRQGDLDALEDFRRHQMYARIEPLTARLSELVELQVRGTDALVHVANQELRRARLLVSIALATTGLLALVVAIAFSRRLASSVRAMGQVVRAAARGDLSRRVALRGGDELADMAADIDEMVRSLEVSRREVEAHACALEASEREARAANVAKSLFLSGMSHELRTPLNVILGYAQLLLREAGRPREEQLELHRIMEAGHHLLGLIDDVLSISKIEAGKLSLRRGTVNPRALLRSLSDMLSQRAQARSLELSCHAAPALPEHVEGDESKLRQVLVNLLGNAIKFTSKGGVSVDLDHVDGRLVVVVSDTGPGISAEDQARLFESFYQGVQGREAVEGTGLGLYISQSLVRLMGGEIRVDSAPGQGARFSFAVPAPASAATSAPARAVAPARLPAARTGLPMLVVDDRASNRDVLARLLRRMGAEVMEAANGEDALARLSEREFSLVWLDLQMPGIDGLAALARVREEERQSGRPRRRIVAITASAIEFDRETALRLGFDDLVSKPFLDETIYRVLEATLGVTLEATGEVWAVDVPSRHIDQHLGAFSPEQRDRLLAHLVLGEMDEAVHVTDEVGDPAARAGVRAVIETFQVDALIGALRAGVPV